MFNKFSTQNSWNFWSTLMFMHWITDMNPFWSTSEPSIFHTVCRSRLKSKMDQNRVLTKQITFGSEKNLVRKWIKNRFSFIAYATQAFSEQYFWNYDVLLIHFWFCSDLFLIHFRQGFDNYMAQNWIKNRFLSRFKIFWSKNSFIRGR